MPNDEVVKAPGLAVFRVTPKDAPAEGTPGAQVVLGAGHAACITVQKRYDEARKEYADILAEYPDYPNLHYVFGKFLAETNDTAGAVAEFQKEIKKQSAGH